MDAKESPPGPGQTRGELWAIGNGERHQVWQRTLINNASPQQVLITNTGKYVVTFGETDQPYDFPLVIYQKPDGRLCSQIHSIRSLGLLDSVARGNCFGGLLWWTEHALLFFDPEGEVLFVRLACGEMLMLELRTGDLMDDSWYKVHKGWAMKEERWSKLQEYGNTQARATVLSLLKADDPEERVTGAIAAGSMHLPEAIPRLKELLTDPATGLESRGNSPVYQVHPVRRAARQALKELGEETGSAGDGTD